MALWQKTILRQKVPSFRGAAAGCEPGTHIPEACVYGFRARRCAAPRNDRYFVSFVQSPLTGTGQRYPRILISLPIARLNAWSARPALTAISTNPFELT